MAAKPGPGSNGTGSSKRVDQWVVLACPDLDDAVDGFRELGLLLTAIGPADEPTWAEMRLPGLRLVLSTDPNPVPMPEFEDPALGTGAPVPATAASVEIQHQSADNWIEGRAGMRYRDLIPGRYGGAYIASHIHIPDGGPVPDYVHHHDVAHQLIYCHRGWVEVVYQDQGPPFVLEPGDCVLQPPGIRHRVLASSDQLFVTEISCPAEHVTLVDNELELPNPSPGPNTRLYGGQRFVRHVGADVPWRSLPGLRFDEQVTDIEAATNGLAAVRMLRAAGDDGPEISLTLHHDEDLLFLFVVSGEATVRSEAPTERLIEASSIAVPPGSDIELVAEPETVLLELRSRRQKPAAP